MLPQAQTGPSSPTRMWPRSPALPLTPRWTRPSTTMPQPTPVPILMNRKSGTCCDDAAVHLAERHDVDVVVDVDRAAEVLRQRGADREAVPAGHDRRGDRHAVAEADRPGDADAGAVQLDRRAAGPHLADEVEHDLQDDVGPLADVDGLGGAVEDVELAVGDGDVDAGGADVDAEEAQGAGQLDDRAAAAAARGGEAGGLGQADLGEPVELDGELGPGQRDDLAELGAARRAGVAQQPQERRLVGVLRAHRHSHPGLLLLDVTRVTWPVQDRRDFRRVAQGLRRDCCGLPPFRGRSPPRGRAGYAGRCVLHVAACVWPLCRTSG